ncbi:MAG: histidine phosphatase family protein [Lewinella sp.]|nr:histidine phosphatase family protein [Lewinella sp.]
MPFHPISLGIFSKFLGLLLVSATLSSGVSRCDSPPPETDPPAPPATVILVRHAEKGYGEDPHLTPDGRVRANRLMHMLRGIELDAVYSTDFKRCMETAQPTAEDHALDVQLYDPQTLTNFAGRLRRRHAGETVLVVGHSNTTPAIVGLFDQAREYPNILETDYSYLYIVTLPDDAPVKVLELHF